ncbi:MAG: lipid II:glycine glycyltransferase FemX [Dermatophilaceae bacterium]
MSARIAVRTISADEHLAFVRSRDELSFLQTPAWGRVKTDWGAESLGWYAGDAPQTLLGAGLVLYRRLPRLKRCLAYLPEGPACDWSDPALVEQQLLALRAHVRAKGAFALRIGPPVVVNRWSAPTVKAAVADPSVRSLTQVPPDTVEPNGTALVETLRRLGLRHRGVEGGFASGQPQFVFQLPLAGRTEADLLAGLNQLWRRNIRKADKAGVEVTRGGLEELADFHRIYAETATRDHFLPRPLAYFRRMLTEMLAEDPDRVRLYLAHHGDDDARDLVAASIWVRVGRHTWYSYGASTSAKREVQGSTAVQWQMMRDALACDADVYDLRGITDTLAEDDEHLGLIRFKVGTGGEAVEYVGEWDLPLNRVLYAAFDAYLRRRA